MENLNKLTPKNIEDILAVTPMQASMLFHYFSQPESGIYHEQICYKLKGKIQSEYLKTAWNFVARNNEMLRTVFRWDGIRFPVQIILKEHIIPFKEYDLSDLNDEERQIQIENIRLEDRKKRVDIVAEPFRVILCRLTECEYEMIVNTHHVLYDGWSNAIIIKELVKAYDMYINNREPVSEVKTKYKELVRWYQKQDKKKQQGFWKEYMKDYAVRPMMDGENNGYTEEENPKEYSYVLDEALERQIYEYVRNNEVTIAALVYTSWGIILSKYNGYKDVAFGITMSGRTVEIKNVESIVGLFINTLPLRIRINPGNKIKKLIKEVNIQTMIFEEYIGTPITDIRNYISVYGESQLFDTLVVVQNYPVDQKIQNSNDSLSISYKFSYHLTNFKLSLSVKTFKGIQLDFSYKKADFCREKIEDICHQFIAILSLIVFDRSDEMGIDHVSIFSNEEIENTLSKIHITIDSLNIIEGVNFDEIF